MDGADLSVMPGTAPEVASWVVVAIAAMTRAGQGGLIDLCFLVVVGGSIVGGGCVAGGRKDF